MNYKKIYEDLITSRQSMNRKRNWKVKDGWEEHHIIPVSFGGPDEAENLILLTPEEHFLAHMLLAEIYKDDERKKGKMIQAAWLMCHTRDGIKISARQYAFLKKTRKEIKLSDEAKSKISLSSKGRIKSAETIKKLQIANSKPRPWRKGISPSPTHSAALSKVMRGRKVPRLSELKKIPIYQLDLTNNIIKLWPSAKDAALSLGVKNGNGTTIGRAAKGKQLQSLGFFWKYEKDIENGNS